MIKKLLCEQSFADLHKRSPADFLRTRKLSFPFLMILIMRSSKKSIQLVLNEAVIHLPDSIMSISNSAYSKARKKISHTAFIALNELAIVGITYQEDYNTLYGKRILAVDGSKVRLPDTAEIRKEFGTHPYRNERVEGEQAFALASVLYDTQNHIALDAILAPTKSSEKDLALRHLEHIKKGDLIIYDRGYGSYELMAKILENKGDFLVRISTRSFKQASEMYADEAITDQVVTLVPNQKVLDRIRKEGLIVAQEITVRFVRVVLSTGETEILATSLMDQEIFTPEMCKELYWERWQVETFYGILKTRLSLENFTGKSVESVKQDFYAAVFLTGLEAVMTEDSEKELTKRKSDHPQKVNKAVSFNVIKENAFALLLSDESIDQIIEKMETLFITNPTLYRPEKDRPREYSCAQRIVHYLKRRCKNVF